MIVRIWRGQAALNNPDAYPEHFRRNVAVELQAVEGFLGASLFRQKRPDCIEFLVETRWRSMDSIRGFAGDDLGKAVVEPGAIAALVSYDDRVQHYELVELLPPRQESGQESGSS